MGINERGEFIRNGVDEKNTPKTAEQLLFEQRQALKQEVRRRKEKGEGFDEIPEDIVAEVHEEDKQLSEKRKRLREQLRNKSD